MGAETVMFGGLEIRVIDAQRQMRTIRDVKVAWLRPKVPSKRSGRKGTRRDWKRKNPPHWLMAYREPEDVLVLYGRIVIATPLQEDALRKATKPVNERRTMANLFGDPSLSAWKH